MSAKPYTLGHDMLVRIAAKECDEVIVFVSTSDRARPGEVPVLGTDMAKIWHDYIERSLPSNVRVKYGGSPVTKTWQEMGKANEAESADTYKVYGDPEDLTQNFPENSFLKYAGNLYKAGQALTRAISREETVLVSGTKMRQWLQSGNEEQFKKHLPKGIDRDAVWRILRATAENPPKVKTTAGAKRARKTEALLREYVSLLLENEIDAFQLLFDEIFDHLKNTYGMDNEVTHQPRAPQPEFEHDVFIEPPFVDEALAAQLHKEIVNDVHGLVKMMSTNVSMKKDRRYRWSNIITCDDGVVEVGRVGMSGAKVLVEMRRQ